MTPVNSSEDDEQNLQDLMQYDRRSPDRDKELDSIKAERIGYSPRKPTVMTTEEYPTEREKMLKSTER